MCRRVEERRAVAVNKSANGRAGNMTRSLPDPVYVDEVSCGQKRSFQSVPKGSQEVDLLNRRGAP